MKKTKWKQLLAIALSAGMAFSSIEAPALAQESEMIGAVQIDTLNEDQLQNALESNTDEQTVESAGEQSAANAQEQPNADAGEQSAANAEEQLNASASEQPNASADKHTRETTKEPFLANVKTIPSEDVNWRPKIQPFGIETKRNDIDPSDLTDWTVYSHYGSRSVYDYIDEALKSGGEMPEDIYNYFRAEKPSNWDSTVNANGKHPWYSTVMGLGITDWGFDKYFDVTDPADIAAWEAGPAQYWSVAAVSDHVFSKGTTNDASITFVGYGTGDFTDWALAPIPDGNTELKAISFDIDAAQTNSHTIRNYGAFINAGISNGLFKGYAVLLSMDTSGVYLVDMSSGIDVDKLHDQALPDNMNVWEPWEVVPAYFVGGGSKAYTMQSGDSYENRANPINLDGTDAIYLGTYDRSATIHVYVEFDQTNIRVEVGRYASPGVPDTPTAVYTGTMKNTGHSAFGPYADYNGIVGDGHTCSQLSWVRFLDMNATIGLKVTFRDIDMNTGEYETKGAVDEIEKGKTISMMASETNNYAKYQFPDVPTKPGQAFVEWNTKADGTGERFTMDTPVNELMTVYAIWADNGINVSYNPDQRWTREDVDIEVAILTAYDPISVIIEYEDGTIQPVQVEKDPANPTRFTKIIHAEKNLVGAKVIAMVSDGQNGQETLALPIDVTWIDKVAPTVANLPGNNAATGLLEASDIKNQVTFADAGSPNANLNGQDKSDIDNTTKMVHFFNEAGTSIVKSISWDNLEQEMANMSGGAYRYVVSVLDKAGNYGDSNGKTGDASTVPDGPGKGPIAVNATKPVINGAMKTKNDNQSYLDRVWTNQDVIVSYDVNSNVKLDFVKENSSNQKVTGNTHGKVTTVTKEGKTTIYVEAGNAAGNADPKGFEIWIDKTKPKAELPKSNTIFDLNDITLEDIPGAGTTDRSGLDNSKTKLTVIPYVNGKPDTDNIEPVTDWTQGTFEPGIIYDLILEGADQAGNATSTTSKGVLYLENKTTPPAVTKDDFTMESLPTDLGSSMKRVRITHNEGLTIKDIRVIINGVDGGSGMYLTSIENSKPTADIAFRYAKQSITFRVYLHIGSVIELPYTDEMMKHDTLATTDTTVGGNGVLNTAQLKAALEGGKVVWKNGSTATPVQNYSIYYKNNTQIVKTTLARLPVLCRTEREVFIVVQDVAGELYHLGRNNAAAKGLPTAADSGIRVQG